MKKEKRLMKLKKSWIVNTHEEDWNTLLNGKDMDQNIIHGNQNRTSTMHHRRWHNSIEPIPLLLAEFQSLNGRNSLSNDSINILNPSLYLIGKVNLLVELPNLERRVIKDISKGSQLALPVAQLVIAAKAPDDVRW